MFRLTCRELLETMQKQCNDDGWVSKWCDFDPGDHHSCPVSYKELELCSSGTLLTTLKPEIQPGAPVCAQSMMLL